MPKLLLLHLLVVLVFLLFYALKAGLLLAERQQALRTVRAHTRIADSGLGLLIVASGAALLWQYPGPAPAWLWTKLGLVLVLLPVSIAALRRQQKVGVVLSLLGLGYVYGLSQTGSFTLRRPAPAATAAPPAAPGQAEAVPTPELEAPTDTSATAATGLSGAEAATLAAAEEASPAAALEAGRALFVQHCATCHGPDGKLGRNGAHDLTKSNLNATGRVYLVTNGLGKMPSFQQQLTPEQIQQVVTYSLTLKR